MQFLKHPTMLRIKRDLNERRIRLFNQIHPHHQRLVQLMLPKFLLSIYNFRLRNVTIFKLYLVLIHLALVTFVFSTILLYKELINENLPIKFSKLTLKQKNLLVDEFLQAKINGTTYTSCNICDLARQLRNFTQKCASDRIDLNHDLNECRGENDRLRAIVKMNDQLKKQSEKKFLIQPQGDHLNEDLSNLSGDAKNARKDSLTTSELN